MSEDASDNMRAGLLQQHQHLLKKLKNSRREKILYRWLNISLFLLCKIIVPLGALIVATNMISIVLGKPLFDEFFAGVAAIVVTFFAGIESMLNPGAKKRLAFTVYNELFSIENKLNMAKISENNKELQKSLMWADDEIKKLLNQYADGGY